LNVTRIIVSIAVLSLCVGCSRVEPSATDSAASKATPAVFNESGAPTVVFNAPDMMCPEGCGAKVKEILSGQPGAKEVLVDFDAKTATVAIDKDANFDSDAAVAALADHGFKNSSLKSGAEAKSPSGDTASVQ
jgi:copper chaperone CopZ